MASPSTAFAPPHAPIPLQEAMPPLRLYFSLRGRIGRRQFWWHGVLGLLLLGLVAMALMEIAGVAPERAEQVANLLILWPVVAISVKRWHDRDRSGWWVLLLVPMLLSQLAALTASGRGPSSTGLSHNDWWVPLVLLPSLIGQLWTVIDNGFIMGSRGPNRFGDMPPR